eukprot:CAMPEP_0168405886 /NCGR_PEP_ID=MMETSP0228-20121227/25369_1 /TAXON_ID=133427 /ORGANISM="Protoceratium reticulatum, Strain CCCM 535 (=CCMP 1889)" /LENGTH=323 /DNA_ID=CAMNT_0008419521 /DNA_START=42 /DNA_END=1010 /DNA_ORIENTATION=+
MEVPWTAHAADGPPRLVQRASKVVGGAGTLRIEAWSRGLCFVVLTSFAPVLVLGFVFRIVWIIGTVGWLLVFLALAYNICADGSRRCLDISMPLRFELSADSLEVTTWGIRALRWQASELESVQVFKQTERYSRCLGGFCTNFRAHQQGSPEAIRLPEQVRSELSSPMSCLLLCVGRRDTCTFAFLGANIRGQSAPVPLSRRVWHERGGLSELFELSAAVQLFREGRLFIGDTHVGGQAGQRYSTLAGATDVEIAALPTRCLEEKAPCEDEGNDCVICLGPMAPGDLVRTLPCSHCYHAECAAHWLRLSAVCPVCKRPIRAAL